MATEERVEHTDTVAETHTAPAAAETSRVGTETVVEPVADARDDERIIAATGRMMRENRTYIDRGFDRVVNAINDSTTRITASVPPVAPPRTEVRNNSAQTDRVVDRRPLLQGVWDMPEWARVLLGLVVVLLVLKLLGWWPFGPSPFVGGGGDYGYAYHSGRGSHNETVIVPDE